LKPVYILCAPDVYDAAMATGTYAPESLQVEGFIHASPAHQLTRVANKYYCQHAALRVLTVDPSKVHAELKWEMISTGDSYPHFYGPLNMDAVVAVDTVTRKPDGSYEISGFKDEVQV
jgi:uncharacterized protein (DUF952 family)